MGPSLIRQELQRQEAKEYNDNDAKKSGILAWMRKNADFPQESLTQKPKRPKSVFDGNPSDPWDDSSTASNTSRSSEKSNKSRKSVPTSVAPSKPDTVGTQERERLR